jgi:hypothetical protein
MAKQSQGSGGGFDMSKIDPTQAMDMLKELVKGITNFNPIPQGAVPQVVNQAMPTSQGSQQVMENVGSSVAAGATTGAKQAFESLNPDMQKVKDEVLTGKGGLADQYKAHIAQGGPPEDVLNEIGKLGLNNIPGMQATTGQKAMAGMQVGELAGAAETAPGEAKQLIKDETNPKKAGFDWKDFGLRLAAFGDALKGGSAVEAIKGMQEIGGQVPLQAGAKETLGYTMAGQIPEALMGQQERTLALSTAVQNILPFWSKWGVPAEQKRLLNQMMQLQGMTGKAIEKKATTAQNLKDKTKGMAVKYRVVSK